MNKEDQDRVIVYVKNMMARIQARKTRVKNMSMSRYAAADADTNDFIGLRLLLAKTGSVALQETGASACKKRERLSAKNGSVDLPDLKNPSTD